MAVNCGGGGYTSTCGVQFLADDTPCEPGDAIPAGAPYCRTNIKGPDGGYAYTTDRTVNGTADPTIFEVTVAPRCTSRSILDMVNEKVLLKSAAGPVLICGSV